MKEVVSIELRPIPTGIARAKRLAPRSNLVRPFNCRTSRCTRGAIPIPDKLPIVATPLEYAHLVRFAVYQDEIARIAVVVLRLGDHRTLVGRDGNRLCCRLTILVEDVSEASNSLRSESLTPIIVEIRPFLNAIPLEPPTVHLKIGIEVKPVAIDTLMPPQTFTRAWTEIVPNPRTRLLPARLAAPRLGVEVALRSVLAPG